jgi:hypothetical protein
METIVRVRFLVDMGHKQSDFVVSQEYLHSGQSIDIPEVPAEAVEHVGDHVDRITVKVFQAVSDD